MQKLEVIYFQGLALGAGAVLISHAQSSFYTGRGFTGVVMHARALFRPGQGLAWGAGVAAAIGFVLLLLYAIPKRGVRFWMRRRGRPAQPSPSGAEAETPVRSRVRPQVS